MFSRPILDFLATAEYSIQPTDKGYITSLEQNASGVSTAYNAIVGNRSERRGAVGSYLVDHLTDILDTKFCYKVRRSRSTRPSTHPRVRLQFSS
jgi:hypothetical protein